MNGISINLLPTEGVIAQKRLHQQKLIQTVSVVAILTVFFLASVVITLRILQTHQIHSIQAQAKTEENKISDLRDKESSLVLLKDRLNLIDKLTSAPKKQAVLYDLIVRKIPPSIILSSASLDTSGNLSASLVIPDINSLNKLFLVISSDEAFQQISGAQVDNLTRGRDGIYRASLKLLVK